MGRLILAVIAFIITFSIVSGLLKFVFNVADALLTFGVGAVIALSVAGGVAGGSAGTPRV